MAASAQELASIARHWAARPLPEPPRTTRLAKSLRNDPGRTGGQLEDWLAELTVGNTLDAD